MPKPLAAAYPSLASILGPFANVAWPWYVLIGLTITFTSGSIAALAHAPAPARPGR